MKKRRWRSDRSSIEPMVQWTGLVAVVVGLGLLYVWQQIQTRDMKRDILTLESRRAQLVQENSRLEVEVSEFSSRDRIEMVAANMLDLEHPMIGQVVSVTDNPSDAALFAGRRSAVAGRRFASDTTLPTSITSGSSVAAR
ncbi:MAG: cell division protein FtsL [Candidatus Latescibacteria bacterium]|jgi:cell division protein FtsL|nr:cell division protein FtsL [Candidatus Latescibacterota bacterium]